MKAVMQLVQVLTLKATCYIIDLSPQRPTYNISRPSLWTQLNLQAQRVIIRLYCCRWMASLLWNWHQHNIDLLYVLCIQLCYPTFTVTRLSHKEQAGYSSVGRASDCRFMQPSDGPWFDSGWPDFVSSCSTHTLNTAWLIACEHVRKHGAFLQASTITEFSHLSHQQLSTAIAMATSGHLPQQHPHMMILQQTKGTSIFREF